MLHRLLRTVYVGGVHSLKQLAQQMNVSEALLGSMIDELVRMGYLKPLQGTCDNGCSRCSMAGTCNIAGSGRIWALTEAGKKTLRSDTTS